MKSVNYLEIFKQALEITWKNKFLWFFGLLIFFGSLDFNLNMDMSKISTDGEKLQVFTNFIQDNPDISLKTGLALVMLLVALFVLRVIGISGIIKSANNIVLYRQCTIKAILSEVNAYLWRLIFLEILLNISVFIVVIIFLVPISYLYALKAPILAIAASIIAAVIFIPLVIVAYYLRRYAYFYVILANVRVKMALEMAYGLFRKHIKESLLMGCVTILTAAAFLIFMAVFVSLVGGALYAFGLTTYPIPIKTSALIILAGGFIVGIVIILLLLSWFFSLIQTAWVLFFQQIAFDKQKEKTTDEKAESAENVPTPEVV